jgi:hypothetical protein
MEICAKLDGVTQFLISYQDQQKVMDLIETHDLIVEVWENWVRDGKIGKLRIIPYTYFAVKKPEQGRESSRLTAQESH